MMKNEIILDGFLYKDAKVFNKLISFQFNMRTHSTKQEDGTYKNAYSSFKVNYFGDKSERLINHLKDGNSVRVYGKVDTEVYENKEGKKVYNVIIIANTITKIAFEKEMKDGKEVSVLHEEVLV